MANTAEIKARMSSVAETKKVTDAMYMISSVKIRKAQREHQNSEHFYESLRTQISELISVIPQTKSRYFHAGLQEGKEHFRHGILLITSDKGLVGAYNQTAIDLTEAYMGRHPETELFIIGEYGRQYFKSRKVPFVEEFSYSAAFPSVWEAEKICIDLLEYYNSKKLDEINIIYTDYMGVKPSECKRAVLLPLDKSTFKEQRGDNLSYKEFYPDPDTVLDDIVPTYLTGFIYSFLVDSYCSEQQTRMLAMSTASKNAEEMLKKLKAQYNAIRQASITNEMIEITSGANSLRGKHSSSGGGVRNG